MRTYDGDLWKWTEAAIDLARRGIEGRGGEVRADDDDELILEVSDVDLVERPDTVQAVVTLRVQSDGRKIAFVGKASTASAPERAFDKALRVAVAGMLSHPTVRERLR